MSFSLIVLIFTASWLTMYLVWVTFLKPYLRYKFRRRFYAEFPNGCIRCTAERAGYEDTTWEHSKRSECAQRPR